jgi:multidrug resistance efflux pump
MTEQGFKGFQRGEYGSTAEHLTSLQYQIKQDKERLEKLQKRIQREQIKYEPARNVSKTYNEIDRMGQKTITGKMAISKEDYSELTALAKEGITSRAEISELEQSANYYRQKYAGYDKDSGYYILEYENEARYPGKTIKVRSFQVQGVARHVIKSL